MTEYIATVFIILIIVFILLTVVVFKIYENKISCCHCMRTFLPERNSEGEIKLPVCPDCIKKMDAP